MKGYLKGAAMLTVVVTLVAAIGAHPRYIEELSIGGGYGESVDGGCDIEDDGTISTDGTLTTNSGATFNEGSVDVDFRIESDDNENMLRVDGGNDRVYIGDSGSSVLADQTFNAYASSYGGVCIQGGVFGQLVVSDAGAAANVKHMMLRTDGGQTSLNSLTDALGWQVENIIKMTHSNGAVSLAGDLTVNGGDVVAGSDGGMRGTLTLWDGSGGNAPGCIRLASPNGTSWYLFVEDDGTVKIHSALPTANGDGIVVGTQQ